MTGKNPWDEFDEELEKLGKADRKARPLKDRFNEECPAALWYVTLVLVYVLAFIVPWGIGVYRVYDVVFGAR